MLPVLFEEVVSLPIDGILSSIDLSSFVPMLTAIIGKVAPISIALIALMKGFGMLKKLVKKA